jgi:hypothetical protein
LRDVIGRALYTYSVDIAHGYQKHLRLIDLRRVPIRIVWFHVSRDLRNVTGKWYISGRNTDPEYGHMPINELASMVAKTLAYAIPDMRYAIGKLVNIKVVPKISFIYTSTTTMQEASAFSKSILDGSDVLANYKRDMALFDQGKAPPEEAPPCKMKQTKPLISEVSKIPARETKAIRSRKINAERIQLEKLRKKSTSTYHRSLWHYKEHTTPTLSQDVIQTSKITRINRMTKKEAKKRSGVRERLSHIFR